MGVSKMWEWQSSNVGGDVEKLGQALLGPMGAGKGKGFRYSCSLLFAKVGCCAHDERAHSDAAICHVPPGLLMYGSFLQPRKGLPADDTVAASNVLYRVHLSQRPERSYLVSLARRDVLEAGRDVEELMDVLGFKPATKVEKVIEGLEYELGDLTVRLGTVSVNKQPQKSIVVEVEYRPCCAAGQARGLLHDLLETLAAAAGGVGAQAVIKARGQPDVLDWKDFKLPSTYGPRHKALLVTGRSL